MQVVLPITNEDRLLAKLTAISLALVLLDMAMPMPLPGVKPGLANIITMLVFIYYGWKITIWLIVLRILVVSIITGQFFLPAMFLSIFGNLAMISVLLSITLITKYLSHKNFAQLNNLFGVMSLSISCSFAHITGQLILARLWLIPHNGLLSIIPLYAASALLFGVINGFIVIAGINKINKINNSNI